MRDVRFVLVSVIYRYNRPLPLCHAQPLRWRLKIFSLKILALEWKLFSEIFFWFFLFSFFIQSHFHKFADIAHLFAPQSLEILFMYN